MARAAGRLGLDRWFICRIVLGGDRISFEALERGEALRSVRTFTDT
jgi:hypothetical protein